MADKPSGGRIRLKQAQYPDKPPRSLLARLECQRDLAGKRGQVELAVDLSEALRFLKLMRQEGER
jgi:hypothetical protein